MHADLLAGPLNKATVHAIGIVCICTVIAYVVYTLMPEDADVKKSIVSDLAYFGAVIFGAAKLKGQAENGE